MYHIIELFEDGKKSVAIVPDEWLIPESINKYFWPSCNADSTWVKNRKKPGPNWNIFTYQRIIKSTSSYQNSVRLLQKAAEKSDLTSSCLSDASDCAATDRATVRQSLPASASSATSASDWSSMASIVEMLPSYFEKSFKKMEEFQNAVEILQRKVDQLEATQKHSEVVASHTTPALPGGFIFPLQEVDQLEQLNDTLAEEGTRQRMVLHLSCFGGSTPKKALYCLLKYLLAPKLSILYSLEGRKGKRRFNSLQYLKAAIYEPIVKRYNNVTKATLDNYARGWLAISCDRDGGRKRREEKKLQMEQFFIPGSQPTGSVVPPKSPPRKHLHQQSEPSTSSKKPACNEVTSSKKRKRQAADSEKDADSSARSKYAEETSADMTVVEDVVGPNLPTLKEEPLNPENQRNSQKPLSSVEPFNEIKPVFTSEVALEAESHHTYYQQYKIKHDPEKFKVELNSDWHQDDQDSERDNPLPNMTTELDIKSIRKDYTVKTENASDGSESPTVQRLPEALLSVVPTSPHVTSKGP
ncbi:uncharacterized protein LOC112556623 isoform X2 [Pomacea canaliculata]|uniref:uncharacterized protein LOC112556623 isoform X2 n=1 Tax=Pomacea canaliculata TaxID=400727 RepID=UPI000D72BFC9|nr:uncharacterized protein LOC112556623 isoform X2 [Pomacea canaliculata]